MSTSEIALGEVSGNLVVRVSHGEHSIHLGSFTNVSGTLEVVRDGGRLAIVLVHPGGQKTHIGSLFEEGGDIGEIGEIEVDFTPYGEDTPASVFPFRSVALGEVIVDEGDPRWVHDFDNSVWKSDPEGATMLFAAPLVPGTTYALPEDISHMPSLTYLYVVTANDESVRTLEQVPVGSYTYAGGSFNTYESGFTPFNVDNRDVVNTWASEGITLELVTSVIVIEDPLALPFTLLEYVPPTPVTINLETQVSQMSGTGDDDPVYANGYLTVEDVTGGTQWYGLVDFSFNPAKTYEMVFTVSTGDFDGDEAEYLRTMSVYSLNEEMSASGSSWHTLLMQVLEPDTPQTVFSFTVGPGHEQWDDNVADPDGFEPKFNMEMPKTLRLYSLTITEV